MGSLVVGGAYGETQSLIAGLEGTLQSYCAQIVCRWLHTNQAETRSRIDRKHTRQTKRVSNKTGGFTRRLAFYGSSGTRTRARLPTRVYGGSEPCRERSSPRRRLHVHGKAPGNCCDQAPGSTPNVRFHAVQVNGWVKQLHTGPSRTTRPPQPSFETWLLLM